MVNDEVDGGGIPVGGCLSQDEAEAMEAEPVEVEKPPAAAEPAPSWRPSRGWTRETRLFRWSRTGSQCFPVLPGEEDPLEKETRF